MHDRKQLFTAGRTERTSRHRPDEPMAICRRHYRNEEAVFYPSMDRVFGRARKRELLPVVQAFEI